MIVKRYFNAHFAQIQTNRKFSIFDQSQGLIPLKKSQYRDFANTNFYSLRGLVFYLIDHQILFQGLFCL